MENRVVLKLWKDVTAFMTKWEESSRKLARWEFPPFPEPEDGNNAVTQEQWDSFKKSIKAIEKKHDKLVTELRVLWSEIKMIQTVLQLYFESTPKNALDFQGFKKFTGLSKEHIKRIKELEKEEKPKSSSTAPAPGSSHQNEGWTFTKEQFQAFQAMQQMMGGGGYHRGGFGGGGRGRGGHRGGGGHHGNKSGGPDSTKSGGGGQKRERDESKIGTYFLFEICGILFF